MPISTTQLNGLNGFKVEVGGGSVAVRGDFNHDGIDDLVIGSPGASPGGRTGAGPTYVVFGAGGFGSVIAESAITGAAGFVIRGVAAGDTSGFAVDYVDLNGDGIEDIVIGAPFVDLPGAADAGSVYVVYGTASPPASSLELSSLNGTNGFVLTGDPTTNGNRAGYSVSAGGDFNQDGRQDILIGSPFPGSMFGPEHSHAYVLYGAATFAASIPLASMTGAAGITYTGSFQDQLGRDVADVGDVNGDGRPDILITRFFEASVGIPDQPTSGRLIFGPPGAAVDADHSWQISEEGPTNDVSAAGDFNGDGIDDFIVALHKDEAFGYGRTASDGVRINAAAVIVYGRTGGWEGTTNGLNSNKGFVMLAPDTSWTVSSAGDFNGDGIADVIVSAGAAAYVVFGSNVPRFDIDLRNMTASEGLAITDVGTASKVAGAGDINDDGFDDVAITSSQGTYVIFGGQNGGDPPGDVTGTDGDDTLTGTAGDDLLQGLGGDDLLRGLGGDDQLVGGTGVDRMEGGSGNDVFYVDRFTDLVVEAVGGGHDRVQTSTTYRLPLDAEIEILEAGNLQGTDAMELTGNDFAQTIGGNAGNNSLFGAGGDDALFGYGGNDFLYGGPGRDLLYGGGGNDTYFVDALDDVFEDFDGGFDRVATASSFMLTPGAHIELLEPVNGGSADALDLTGNELGQTINGNEGVNILRGEGGADLLYGHGGTDYLIGGAGDDGLYGGTGNDTYYIGAGDANDLIVELAGEGSDRVATLVSYALTANASIEIFEATNSTSTNAMDLTGNGFDNLIAGNFGINILRGGDGNDTLGGYDGADTLYGENGNDTLVGGPGNDTMSGGEGSDKYYVTDAGDVIVEPVAPGDDVVAASISYTLGAGADVEILEPITFNATDPLNFTGNEFGNIVVGNNGANILNGGLGGDVLQGLGGQDSFAFTTALGNGNVDKIEDFVSGVDKILLEDSVFTGLNPGALPAGAFVTGSQAADADDRIVYNSITGALYFDADGSGAGTMVQFAALDGAPALAAADFIVI